MIQTLRRDDPRLTDILETIAQDLHNVITDVSPIQAVLAVALEVGDEAPPDVGTVTVSFIDRAIQLSWSNIAEAQFYEIREGADWDSATYILRTASLSAVLNPRVAGVHSMLISALASNGLYSLIPTAFTITIPVLGTPSLTTQVIDNAVLLWWTGVATGSVFKINYYNVYNDRC